MTTTRNMIDKIEDTIFSLFCDARCAGKPEPTFKIVFSPKGYNDARHQGRTACYFDREFTKFAGYKYEIDAGQAEYFKVVEIDK